MPGQHVCPVPGCGKSYGADRNLKRHMRDVHSNIYGNYRCPKCGRGFNKKAQYDKHVAGHGQPGLAPAPPLPTTAPPTPTPTVVQATPTPAPSPPPVTAPEPVPPTPEPAEHVSEEGSQGSGYQKRPLPKMPSGFKPFNGGHFITRKGKDGAKKSIFIPSGEGKRGGIVVVRGDKDGKAPNIPTDTTPHPPKEEPLAKPSEFDKVTLARFDREHPVPDSGSIGLKLVNGKNGPEWVDTQQNLIYWKQIERFSPKALGALKDTDIPKYYVDMPLRDAPKGLVYEIRQAFAMNRDAVCNNQMPVNLMLQGPPGTGKTIAVEAAAHDLGLPLFYFSASSDVNGKAQLLGRLSQNKEGRWVWRDGLITQAARYGGILCIDEFSLLDPEVQSALHALLDKKRVLDLTAYNGEMVKVHPDCMVVACMNPSELGTLGVREVTEPIRRRFNFIMVDYPPMKTELGMIQKQAGLSSSDLSICSNPERNVCGGTYGAPITAFERTIDEVRKMVMKNEGDVKFMPTASEAVMFARYLQRGRTPEDSARLALIGKYVGDSRKQVEAIWDKKKVEAQAQVQSRT